MTCFLLQVPVWKKTLKTIDRRGKNGIEPFREIYLKKKPKTKHAVESAQDVRAPEENGNHRFSEQVEENPDVQSELVASISSPAVSSRASAFMDTVSVFSACLSHLMLS